MMVLARAPYRLTFGGGGTDLMSYASRFGGFTLTATIDRYVRVQVSDTDVAGAAGLARLDGTSQLATTALNFLRLSHCQVLTRGDLASGSGLGSSAAFLVALTCAARHWAGDPTDPATIASQAYHIESALAGRPAGTQDFYASAFGGFIQQTVNRDGTVEVSPLPVAPETVAELESRLLLLDTGLRRSSQSRLRVQVQRTAADDRDTLEALEEVKDLALLARTALREGRVDDLGRLLQAQWSAKRRRDPLSTSDRIEACYRAAREAGAVGGKLVGAGGGGYLLVVAGEGRQERIRDALAASGVEVCGVTFDRTGAAVERAAADRPHARGAASPTGSPLKAGRHDRRIG